MFYFTCWCPYRIGEACHQVLKFVFGHFTKSFKLNRCIFIKSKFWTMLSRSPCWMDKCGTRSVVACKFLGSISWIVVNAFRKFATIMCCEIIVWAIVFVFDVFCIKLVVNFFWFVIVGARPIPVMHIMVVRPDCNCLLAWSDSIHKCRGFTGMSSLFKFIEIWFRLISAWANKRWSFLVWDQEIVDISVWIMDKCHFKF